jgi:hypothetical protein
VSAADWVAVVGAVLAVVSALLARHWRRGVERMLRDDERVADQRWAEKERYRKRDLYRAKLAARSVGGPLCGARPGMGDDPHPGALRYCYRPAKHEGNHTWEPFRERSQIEVLADLERARVLLDDPREPQE